MQYLVMTGDGRFAADAKARKFTTEYPGAWLFDAASDAQRTARMLQVKDPGARAISAKAYDEETKP